METLGNLIEHPFTWGLVLGLIFAGMAWWRYYQSAFELSRQQRIMGEKIALEHDNWRSMREELDALRKENENLRLKIADLNRAPARRTERDLEMLARAAQKMVMAAPGFAQAWESAKNEALTELEAEERGRSLPRRLYEGLMRGKTERLPAKSGLDVQLKDHEASDSHGPS